MTAAAATQIFGLFELDPAGTVMYSRIDPQTKYFRTSESLIGRNFFDEIAPSESGAEIQKRFRYFAKGSDPAEKFTFTCFSGQQPVEIKVMLTQISQREYHERGKLIIVDIRPVSDAK